MANNAVSMQLPLLVRRPKMVWPKLDEAGLHQYPIAGDGNCLFASLAFQLYGDYKKHGEVRDKVIQQMRDARELYEPFVTLDDLVARRETRTRRATTRKAANLDPYEAYLAEMSKFGVYGGQAELMAFIQAYDRDVVVYLPPSSTFKENPLKYINHDRPLNVEVLEPLHICYGGDESARPHYDSTAPNQAFLSGLRPLFDTSAQSSPRSSPDKESSSTRARRASRDMMHDLVTRGTREARRSLEVNGRARSPSVTSSHYSTGSKRSAEDDPDQSRSVKKTNTANSLLTRAAMSRLTNSPKLRLSVADSRNRSSRPATPTSSQDADSSDQGDTGVDKIVMSSNVSPVNTTDPTDDDDSDMEFLPVSRRRKDLVPSELIAQAPPLRKPLIKLTHRAARQDHDDSLRT